MCASGGTARVFPFKQLVALHGPSGYLHGESYREHTGITIPQHTHAFNHMIITHLVAATLEGHRCTPSTPCSPVNMCGARISDPDVRPCRRKSFTLRRGPSQPSKRSFLIVKHVA